MKRSFDSTGERQRAKKHKHKKDKIGKGKKDKKKKSRKDKKSSKEPRESKRDLSKGTEAAATKATAGGGIDDIFGAYQANKKERVKKREREAAKKARQQQSYAEERSKILVPVRVDADTGFNVYTEEQLGISTKGGDTPLCPFDCQCCF